MSSPDAYRPVAEEVTPGLADRRRAHRAALIRIRTGLLRELERDGMVGPVGPRQRVLSHLLDEVDAALDGAA